MAASWSVMRFVYCKYNVKLFKGRLGFWYTRSRANADNKSSRSLLEQCHFLNRTDRQFGTISSAPKLSNCSNNNNVLFSSTRPACENIRRRKFYRQFHQSKSVQTGDQKNTTNGKEIITYDIPTAPGDKKDTTCPLPSAYSPRYVEAAWYEWWVNSGVFTPEYNEDGGRKVDNPFVMCLPPPNVTGNLHLGHALTNSIQDALIRWHRMKGETTLWNPGTDHAGIATQIVVEKKLWREKRLTRHDLGREKFVEEIWKWKREKGEIIHAQMKKMGSSLDWNRARFTMDEPMSRAVTEAFIRLHDEGLIYRSNRLVNWCCHLKSTISDIEVENMELKGRTLLDVPDYSQPIEFGVLHSFAYPVDGTDEVVSIATTRLETMLGDVAVAVHPDDERFRHLHGKFLLHPFEERRIPVIVDEFVEKSFGSGAVKITPAHDYTDYEVALKHNLPLTNILDDEGRLSNVSADFQGLKRFEARGVIREALKEKGLYKGSQDNPMVLPICSRSGDVIEPRLKEQWFVSCQDMAKEAIQAVRSKELEIIPAMFTSEWFHWLENIKDWCVSRQLWWGHRIPAYLAKSSNSQPTDPGVWICAKSEDEARIKAASKLSIPETEVLVKQDEDVLDTWFSSALFPFAVFGWPHQTEDLKKYFPTSLVETGHDILFFWVVRMVMLSKKLTGYLPFKQILLHGILRDSHGRKMSKSLGNVIDPLDVIYGIPLQELQNQLTKSNLSPREVDKAKLGQRSEYPDGIPECGTDALRFTLCSYNFKAHEINMDVTHVKSNRHFCNKIWQAFKFVMMNLTEDFTLTDDSQLLGDGSPIDQWILSRLSHMVQSCDQHFQSHDLHLVTKSLHQFWYSEFCNIYLECVKPLLWGESSSHKESVQHTLWFCIDTALRATSPFMPFLTEELYQRLPHKGRQPESICVAPYPSPEDYPWRQPYIDSEMDVVLQITNKMLSVKKDFNVRKVKPKCFITVTNQEKANELQKYEDVLSILSRSGDVKFIKKLETVPTGCVSSIVNQDYSVNIQLKDLLDPMVEEERLLKRQKKIQTNLERLVSMTEKKGYTYKTPSSVQERNSEKIGTFQKELGHIQTVLDSLDKLR